jgi:hypothetical protein
VVFWAAVAYPVSLWAGETAWLLSAVAMGLCLLPAAATLVWMNRTASVDPTQQVYAWLGGTGIRLFFVGAAGVVLTRGIPDIFDTDFLIWLLVFYLFTLALEVGLVLPRQGKDKPSI